MPYPHNGPGPAAPPVSDGHGTEPGGPEAAGTGPGVPLSIWPDLPAPRSGSHGPCAGPVTARAAGKVIVAFTRPGDLVAAPDGCTAVIEAAAAVGRPVLALIPAPATMADVATAAGVSQGLPYRYFADKDTLVRALVTEAVQQADAEGSPLAAPGSAGRRLHGLVASLVQARQAQPELFLLLQHVVSDPATPRDLLELIQARGRAVAGAMRQLITEAQAAGEAAPDDPDQLVTAVMACLDGLGRFSLGRPEQAARHFPAAHIIARMLEPWQPQAGEHPREHPR